MRTYLKQLGLNPEEYLRAENPKLLILNAVKGAAILMMDEDGFMRDLCFRIAASD